MALAADQALTLAAAFTAAAVTTAEIARAGPPRARTSVATSSRIT